LHNDTPLAIPPGLQGEFMFRIALLAATVALAACGGGGSGPAPVAIASAEGFWSGTASTGAQVSMVILENGETWGLYASSGSIVGALFGNAAVNGSTISGSGSDFNLISRTVTAGTFTGSVATKTSLNLTTSSGAKLNAAYDATYDQTPSLATLAGTFAGQAVSGSTAAQASSVTISATGALSSTGTGCSATGSVTPRPTGKNIFNVSVTFTGASCALGNGTVTTGVASFNPATRQLLSMAMNPAKSDGFIYVGAR
jgi:hypothetical protein